MSKDIWLDPPRKIKKKSSFEESSFFAKKEQLTKEQLEIREQEVRNEIEKLAKRRLIREQERQKWERERARLALEKERLNSQGRERDEDQFLLGQIKLRTNNRLKENRAQVIDILYVIYAGYKRVISNEPIKDDHFLHSNPEVKLIFPRDIPPPSEIITEMKSIDAIDKLLTDVNLFITVESNPETKTNFTSDEKIIPQVDYWKCAKTLIEDTKQKLEPKDNNKNNSPDLVVKEEIDNLLNGKSYDELLELEEGIKMTMETEKDIDYDYWESMLKRLVIYKAQALINDVYNRFMKDIETLPKQSSQEKPVPIREQLKLVHKKEESQDYNDITSLNEDELYLREVENGFEENEEAFKDIVALDDQNENSLKQWAANDKYRPRKPKFFNKVKTGYEWNKYNQTHYDIDNPPPKIVQGYKFNIFYPDLIDKTKTPQYFIEKSDSPDFVILRFHAGPPYLDIAFKIVNKEWEYSHKKGFKSLFTNGTLHLWFNFKRLKYRR